MVADPALGFGVREIPAPAGAPVTAKVTGAIAPVNTGVIPTFPDPPRATVRESGDGVSVNPAVADGVVVVVVVVAPTAMTFRVSAALDTTVPCVAVNVIVYVPSTVDGFVCSVRFNPVPDTVAEIDTFAGSPVCDSTSGWFTFTPAGVNKTVVDAFGFTDAALGLTVPVPVPGVVVPTVTGRRTLSVSEPVVAVTVMLVKPATAVEEAERVIVVSAAVVLFGTNVAVTPVGRFVAAQLTFEPVGNNRPQRIATFDDAPRPTVAAAGVAVSAVPAATVRVIFVVRARARTVISDTPAGAPFAVSVRVTDGLVAVAALKLGVIFPGRPSTAKSRISLNVPVRLILMVAVAVPNEASDIAAGSAVKV